jgi:hypothetical protein
MKVRIKSFGGDVSVQKKGIEFEVRTPNGRKHLGDCYITIFWPRISHSVGFQPTWLD